MPRKTQKYGVDNAKNGASPDRAYPCWRFRALRRHYIAILKAHSRG